MIIYSLAAGAVFLIEDDYCIIIDIISRKEADQIMK